jgi:predicted nucleic acid-binding protein
VFCSDDFAARRLARSYGLTISGTLGVLVALVHDGQLSFEEAELLLQEMIRCGYRSPVDSLSGLMEGSGD